MGVAVKGHAHLADCKPCWKGGQDVLANWRDWVADGRATVKGEVLWLMQPPLSVAEWIACYTLREGTKQ